MENEPSTTSSFLPLPVLNSALTHLLCAGVLNQERPQLSEGLPSLARLAGILGDAGAPAPVGASHRGLPKGLVINLVGLGTLSRRLLMFRFRWELEFSALP